MREHQGVDLARQGVAVAEPKSLVLPLNAAAVGTLIKDARIQRVIDSPVRQSIR
jgi:hypothetical protein